MTTTSRTSLLAALALCAAMLAACSPAGPRFRSTDITGADFGHSLSLVDFDGKPRTLADFRGKAVVLFFGYTHCPDVCPTTLADLAGVMNTLGPLADRVQVLFVTVDPARDTAAVLRQYVPAFDPRFLGLYGDAAATAKAAKEFHIYYEKSSESAPGVYTMNHSSQCYVIDPQGRLRLLVRAERISADLPEDLRTLLGG